MARNRLSAVYLGPCEDECARLARRLERPSLRWKVRLDWAPRLDDLLFSDADEQTTIVLGTRLPMADVMRLVSYCYLAGPRWPLVGLVPPGDPDDRAERLERLGVTRLRTEEALARHDLHEASAAHSAALPISFVRSV